MAKRKRSKPPTMLLWDRNMQRRFVDAVERLNALVAELQGDLAVLRVQVDRLEKVGPKPRKATDQKAEVASRPGPGKAPSSPEGEPR